MLFVWVIISIFENLSSIWYINIEFMISILTNVIYYNYENMQF
jgi:hypothetical protein